MERQDESIPVEELEKEFETYKGEHDLRHSELFFKDHRRDTWFQEKYHPEQIYKLKKERDSARDLEKEFMPT